MIKLGILLLLIGFQLSCKSNDDDCNDIYDADATRMTHYIPNYIYATESTNLACYEHGLKVIEKLNAERDDFNYPTISCTSSVSQNIYYQYQQEYKMDSLPDNFIHNLETIETSEVEELVELICGREVGDEAYKIQSIENYEFLNGELKIEFTVGNYQMSRSIKPSRDYKFDCPLYRLSCKNIYTRGKD